MILLFVGAAAAGCGIDPDEPARLAAAPFVAVGTVLSVEADAEGNVRSRVHVDQTLKGSLTRPEIWLDAGPPGGTCPPWGAYAPGLRVWVIGAPEDGSVDLDLCGRTTGAFEVAPPAWLAEMAAAHPETARAFTGIEAAPKTTPNKVFPKPGSKRVRLVQAGEAGPARETRQARPLDAWAEGAVATEDGPRLRAIFEDDGFEVALWVDRADADLVPRAPTPLFAAPGDPSQAVILAPGAHLERAVEQGGLVAVRVDAEDEGVHANGFVALASLDRTWVPAPEPEPGGDLAAKGPLAILGSPGGALRVTLDRAEDVAIRADGAPRDGYVPVFVHTSVLDVHGWVPVSAVAPGGQNGYGVGGGRLASGAWIQVPEGAIAWFNGVAFARAALLTEARWVATHGSTAYVLVPTPFGPFVGELRCASIQQEERVCVNPK